MKVGRTLSIILACALLFGSMGISAFASSSYSLWAEDELNEAAALGLICGDLNRDYQKNITRQEFAELMVSLYGLLHGSVVYEYETPFTDVDDVHVSTAYSLGIISGMGDGIFAPEQEITREQMAVMLHNLLSGLFYEDASSDSQLRSFNDAGKVSSWAHDAAAFITAHGIIQGYSGGFHPQEKASREVAVVMAKRVAVSYLDEFGQPICVTLNGCTYALKGRPVWDGENLWLPTGELMSLLALTEIDDNENYICAWYMDEDMNFLQCNFSAGNYDFSPDTMGDVWIGSTSAPYSLGGHIYVTESMIEYIFGDFINFNSGHSTVDIMLEDKDMSDIQKNNTNPFFPLKLKDESQLVDTRVNSLVSSCISTPADDWYNWVDNLKKDGVTRARFVLNASDSTTVDFAHADIEQEIPEDYIKIYRQMKDLGIKAEVSLNFWDMAYRESGGTISRDRLSSEAELERYLDYVEMVVTSLKGLVYSYDFWNEPDANYFTNQRIRVEDYIRMARRAIPIIRSIDPEAKIVLAATSSYMEKECQEYTQEILESDIVALADIISIHSVNNDASPVFHSDYYYGYDAMWDDIKKTAQANGFKGEYMADELNYRSFYSLYVLQPEPNDYHPYEPEEAAKYIARMIAINRGMGISAGTAQNSMARPIEGTAIRNMAYIFDELEAADLPVLADVESGLIRYYTFKDDDGNCYLAIWNDIAAAVNCEPVECDISLPGLSAVRVTALDSYNTLERELMFKNGESGFILTGIMLTDYPVIIRIQ